MFALELGLRVIGTFVLCLCVGMWLDAYFHTQPILLLIGLIVAFINVIKLLLGVGHHE